MSIVIVQYSPDMKKARNMDSQGFSHLFWLRLTLTVLRSSSRTLETVFLTFLLTCITCEEACGLQCRTIVCIGFEECSGDAVTHSAGLACIASAVNINLDVKLTNSFR